jgi:hypothetical protein
MPHLATHPSPRKGIAQTQHEPPDNSLCEQAWSVLDSSWLHEAWLFSQRLSPQENYFHRAFVSGKGLTANPTPRYTSKSWGCSSAGRALEWHSRGQGFDPPQLHHYHRISQRPATDVTGRFLFWSSSCVEKRDKRSGFRWPPHPAELSRFPRRAKGLLTRSRVRCGRIHENKHENRM